MAAATKLCGACGGKSFTAFVDETFMIEGEAQVHGLSGDRCDNCGEVYFDHESQSRYVQASDAWVLARREEDKKMLARVRKKLGLTQHQAARLTGGGHNAFGRYERGDAQPMPAVINLFKLLDKHPGLLAEVQPGPQPRISAG